MKKLFSSIALIIAFNINATAQAHPLRIENNTDCDIAIDVCATCLKPEPCKEFCSMTMMTIPAHSFLDFPVGTYPFLPGNEPDCENWRWYKAHIVIFCNGNPYYYTIGGGWQDTNCPVPPRNATHNPPPEGCCGNDNPIIMNMMYSAWYDVIDIHY